MAPSFFQGTGSRTTAWDALRLFVVGGKGGKRFSPLCPPHPLLPPLHTVVRGIPDVCMFPTPLVEGRVARVVAAAIKTMGDCRRRTPMTARTERIRKEPFTSGG